MPSLWVLTTLFNPAGYKSRIDNFHIFRENMLRQNVNLLIVELAFGNDPFYLKDVHQLRSQSILWQKERMLNYALSQLPPECQYIAWIDGDVLMPDGWEKLAIQALQNNDIIQMFEEVKHLPPKETSFKGNSILTERGLVWQSKTHPNFIELRKTRKLNYATTGFAWAAKRSLFQCGFYDKHVLGTNDNIIIDSCIGTAELHHYWNTVGPLVKNDMLEWQNKFGINKKADYLPITIYHLFHGHKKNRGYLTREDTIRNLGYDPKKDIKLENNVYEWATNKPALHEAVKNYFPSRKEDE